MIFLKIIQHHVKVRNKMKTVPRLLNKNIKHSYVKIIQKKASAPMVKNADLPMEIRN